MVSVLLSTNIVAKAINTLVIRLKWNKINWNINQIVIERVSVIKNIQRLGDCNIYIPEKKKPKN